MCCPSPSTSVTSTGTWTKMRLSALCVRSNIVLIAFFFGHCGSSIVPICWGTRRAKKMSVWIGKQAVYFRSSLLWRSIKRNLCRRGTREIRFALDWPILGGLALAVRGEVRRASSKIGTSAPIADSGQAIWVGDMWGDRSGPRLLYFRSRHLEKCNCRANEDRFPPHKISGLSTNANSKVCRNMKPVRV